MHNIFCLHGVLMLCIILCVLFQRRSFEDEGCVRTKPSDGRRQRFGASTGGSETESAETGGRAEEEPGR